MYGGISERLSPSGGDCDCAGRAGKYITGEDEGTGREGDDLPPVSARQADTAHHFRIAGLGGVVMPSLRIRGGVSWHF
jgi:hypothetical protein